MKRKIVSLPRTSFIMFIKYNILQKLGLKYFKSFTYERSIEKNIPKIETKIKPPVKIQLLPKDEVNSLPSKIRRKALDALRNGELCFFATVKDKKDKFAGYAWLSLKRDVYIPEFDREVRFRYDGAYIYDVYVTPKFRGKNIGKKLIEKILHYLKSGDTGWVYVSVDTDNIHSQRMVERMGFYPTELISYLRIFMFKKYKEHCI